MIRRGLRPALSSDAPATSRADPIDPWLGIKAAVTRTTWAGSRLGAEECISLGDALRCYTANAASALSLERWTGSIEVGKDADLVVLSDDPAGLMPERLEKVRATLVFVKGRIAYGKAA
jgi:predicted amidohydrolase YtcJ